MLGDALCRGERVPRPAGSHGRENSVLSERIFRIGSSRQGLGSLPRTTGVLGLEWLHLGIDGKEGKRDETRLKCLWRSPDVVQGVAGVGPARARCQGLCGQSQGGSGWHHLSSGC